MTIDQFFKGLTGRVFTLAIVVLAVPTVLIYRLWHEQLRLGTLHQQMISKQSIRRIRIPPIRGRIFSRDGKLFTDNEPVFDVIFHVHEMRQPGRGGLKRTVSFLFQQLNYTADVIGRKLNINELKLQRHIYRYPALPLKAFTDLNENEIARLFELMPGIPGMEVSTRMKRVYPFADAGAHSIGFVGQKDPKFEEEREAYSYFLPELSGRTGLERIYDDDLRGKGGSKLVRVDSIGFFHEEAAEAQEAVSGNDIILTIDSRAQEFAQNAMRNKRGALILLDCNNGAVLAMVSSPSYNLQGLTGKEYTALANDDENYPLLNRCIAGGYSPGSIIKPLIGMAILEEKLYDADDLFDCPGYYRIGDTRIGCSNPHGHGPLNIIQALECSCNPYFINGGLKLGVDRIRILLAKAGIGQDTGIEIRIEGSSGLLPGRGMKRQRRNEPWNAFDTALISIGQGMITTSPLQVALYTAAIANGGTIYKASLIRAIKDNNGHYIETFKPEVRNRLGISRRSLRIIQQGMYRVVYGENATAPAAKTGAIELAGKTGTAEIGFGEVKRKNTWFICYGPVKSPRYAMVVLVEDGVSGGKTAAPLAKQFFEFFIPRIALGRN